MGDPLRVLILDDVESDAILVQGALERAGIRFVGRHVDSEPAFRRALGEFAPDLVLSDFSLPGFDALGALALARQHDSNLPFIVVTGSLTEETAADCIKAGASDYVIKEHLARLPVAVQGALDRQRVLNEKRDAEREREQLLSRERLQRQTAETLAAANLALAQRHDLPSILDTLLDYLERLVPSDSSTVLLLDEQGLLEVGALRGHEKWADPEAVRRVKFDAGTNRLLREVLVSRLPVVVDDTTTDPRWERVAEGAHVRSWLGVPLVIREKAIGIYSVDRTEPGVFTEEHVRLAVSLAPAAATAVEMARLLRDVREAGEFNQQIIASAQDGIIVFDRHLRYQVWNQAMVALTGLPAADVIGKTRSGLFEEPAAKDLHALQQRALAGETTTSPDIEGTAPDGSALWTSVRFAPLRDAAGDISGVIAVVRDITERKRIEASRVEQNRILERITARMRAVIDGALDAVIGMDAAGLVTAWNPRAETIFGWSAGEAVGRPVADLLVPPAQREAHRKGLARYLETGRSSLLGRRIELSALRRDGSSFPVELTIVGSEDAGGVVFTAFVADISERKESARLLAESEERFRQIAENIREVFWMTDGARERLIYVSPAYEAIWGLSRASLYDDPTSFVEAIHADDRERVRGRIARQASGDYDEIYRIFRPDDSMRWIHDRAFPVHDPEGNVVRIVGSAQDITELKQAEQALRDSERRYRRLFESSPDGIFVTDADARYVDVNPSGQRMLGYSLAELMDMTPADIIDSSETSSLAEALVRIWEGGADHNEWRLRRKDGSVFNAEVLGSLTADGRMLALVRDVSERRRMEDQLRQSQKMEAVGRLAGGIAHDFNNILGVITGYGEMLRRRMAPDHPDRRRIDEILKAAERGGSLTHQLLAFSRKQVLEPKVVEPSVVVTEMRRLLEPLVGEHIDLTVKAEARGRVRADRGQLEQVVLNLVVNARDAMPMGGSLSIDTGDVALDQDYVQRREVAIVRGPYVRISVGDSGVGMDEATKARIFEPFFTTKPEGKGTGLGLATVYGIVKQSGGYVWAYSEVGHGTTFHVYLPRVEAEVSVEPKRPAVHRRMATETVLVVEDEPAALELVAELLRAEGYMVLLARNGQEAIEVATQTRVPLHLLLTDVILPKLSGRVAAERIRAIHPRVKILYMSGYTDDEVSRHGILTPGILLLQKPFTPEELTRRVGQVLDER